MAGGNPKKKVAAKKPAAAKKAGVKLKPKQKAADTKLAAAGYKKRAAKSKPAKGRV